MAHVSPTGMEEIDMSSAAVVVDMKTLGWLKLEGGNWLPWPKNDPNQVAKPSVHNQGFSVMFYTKLFADEQCVVVC